MIHLSTHMWYIHIHHIYNRYTESSPHPYKSSPKSTATPDEQPLMAKVPLARRPIHFAAFELRWHALRLDHKNDCKEDETTLPRFDGMWWDDGIGVLGWAWGDGDGIGWDVFLCCVRLAIPQPHRLQIQDLNAKKGWIDSRLHIVPSWRGNPQIYEKWELPTNLKALICFN